MNNWHLIAYFSKKIIWAKPCYQIHDQELLEIIKTFKISRYYLKDYIFKVFVLSDHINFSQLINKNSLSLKQV